jgi:HD-GYP domain-containing protein (c-di-GMP phosphodiesterase class II)
VENKTNTVHSIDSAEFSVKSPDELLPVDITLHPIYRPDGLMLVNRYTPLLPFMLNQIKKHLADNMPISILVASSEEMLNNFIDNKVYSNPEFVMILDNVIRESLHCYNVPLSIESYVDERVDLKSSLRDIAELKLAMANLSTGTNKKSKIQENIDNKFVSIDKYPILGKITSAETIWSNFETRLASEELQNRANIIKKKFLNVISEDITLMKLIFRMSIFDDSLIIHSVNTACLSIVLGLLTGINDEDLIHLAITGLFCNIGFINLSKESYQEYLKGTYLENLISEHIKCTLEIISASTICRNKAIIFGILEHHEEYNGGGLPAKKRGRDICLYGRILSIALKFENYINKDSDTDISNLNNIEKMICRNIENKYDQDILNLYLRNSNSLNRI